MGNVSSESERWLGLLGDLFTGGWTTGDVAGSLATELCESLGAQAAGLHWRNRNDSTGLRQWPEVIPAEALKDYLARPHLLFEDRLWAWFDRTQDPTPISYDRVPQRARESASFAAFQEFARAMGIHHRLAVPLLLGQGYHATFVLTRRDSDFEPDDIELATRLQPLLAALQRQTAILDDLRPHLTGVREAGLTARETCVLRLLAQGLTAFSISRRLGISERTVHKHLQNSYLKLGVSDRLSAVRLAHTLGLVS
jgi:DNA-binding CsgD family transcriptional regulator